MHHVIKQVRKVLVCTVPNGGKIKFGVGPVDGKYYLDIYAPDGKVFIATSKQKRSFRINDNHIMSFNRWLIGYRKLGMELKGGGNDG